MKKIEQQLLIAGVLLGVCFPVLALIIDFNVKNIDFSFSGLLALHELNPLHYIIDSAPFVLGGISYLLGMMITKRENKLKIVDEDLERFSYIKNFITSLHEGKLDEEIDKKYKEDEIIRLLIKLRDSIKSKRQAEQIRHWINEGLSHFNTLLNNLSKEPEKTLPTILIALGKHLNINQGSLFIVNNDSDNPFLELKACFAWERQKFFTKTLAPGQSLAGQCWLEKEPIYMTDIPDNYINIGSGLGDAKPTAVLIQPLISNGQVMGILELASFRPFEDHEREFIENFSENLAVTIANLQVNRQMRNMLSTLQNKKHTENNPA